MTSLWKVSSVNLFTDKICFGLLYENGLFPEVIPESQKSLRGNNKSTQRITLSGRMLLQLPHVICFFCKTQNLRLRKEDISWAILDALSKQFMEFKAP